MALIFPQFSGTISSAMMIVSSLLWSVVIVLRNHQLKNSRNNCLRVWKHCTPSKLFIETSSHQISDGVPSSKNGFFSTLALPRFLNRLLTLRQELNSLAAILMEQDNCNRFETWESLAWSISTITIYMVFEKFLRFWTRMWKNRRKS